MSDKITLTNLVNLQNETTAINSINNNNAVITTAFDNTLSRDGTSPNQMSANLDMNGNRIINLPAPVSNTEPMRVQDANTLNGGGTITVSPLPSGGNTGQVLEKNSGTNFDVSWQTIHQTIPGGSAGQVLSKNTGTDYDLGWSNSVTGVTLTAPSDFTVTGSPITSSGTIGMTWQSTPTGSGAIVRQNSPTISAPAISTITNGGTLTLPTGTDTILSAGNTATITNKNIPATQLTGTIPTNVMPALVGDVTSTVNTATTAISLAAVTNAKLANMNAYTLKGNSTSSSAAPVDIDITALTSKASPANGDIVLIQDVSASNAFKQTTVGAIATAGSVSSVGGLTGAITLGPGLGTSSNSLTVETNLIGEIKQVAFNRVPANYLAANGAAISRTTYSALYGALVVSSTVTLTIASPCVVTWTGNQLNNGDPILLTTSGALPTGLATATKYYVINLSGNTFNLATSPGGSAINTSGSQSGTQTATNAPWEGTAVGDGSTTFTLPNLNGNFIRGIDNGRGTDSNRSFGSSQTDAFQNHTFSFTTIYSQGLNSSAGAVPTLNTSSEGSAIITGVGGITSNGAGTPRTASETRPVNYPLLYIIRYQ